MGKIFYTTVAFSSLLELSVLFLLEVIPDELAMERGIYAAIAPYAHYY